MIITEQRLNDPRLKKFWPEMEHELDKEYLESKVDDVDAFFDSRFSDIKKPGLENIDSIPKDSNVILVPSHSSHLDEFVVLRQLYPKLYGHIVAGDNMFIPFFTKPVGPIPAYLDLAKMGAFKFERKRSKDAVYLMSSLAFQVQKMLKLDGRTDALLLFGWPGRTYTGQYGAPEEMTLHATLALSACATDPSVPTFEVPITVSYEFVPESRIFQRLIEVKDKKLVIGKKDIPYGRWWYQWLDFNELMLKKPPVKGRVIVSYGEPLNVNEIYAELGPTDDAITKINQEMRRRILDMHHVFELDLMMIAYCTEEDARQEGRVFKADLPKHIDAVYKRLRNHEGRYIKFAFDETNFDPDNALETALEQAEPRGIVKPDRRIVRLLDPNVQYYHANRTLQLLS